MRVQEAHDDQKGVACPHRSGHDRRAPNPPITEVSRGTPTAHLRARENKRLGHLQREKTPAEQQANHVPSTSGRRRNRRFSRNTRRRWTRRISHAAMTDPPTPPLPSLHIAGIAAFAGGRQSGFNADIARSVDDKSFRAEDVTTHATAMPSGNAAIALARFVTCAVP